MNKAIIQYLVSITVGILVICNSHAAAVFVSQELSPGAGDFSSNQLGTIQSFSTAGTLAGFYNYAGQQFNNAAISLTADKSHLFLVDASDGLGLFVVHDDGLSSGTGDAENKVNLFGDTAIFLVYDDPSPTDVSYTENGTEFTAKQRWTGGFTDGYVIGSLDGNWVIDVQFTDVYAGGAAATISGLDSWAALSSDGQGGQTEIALTLAEDRRVRLSIVPIPAAVWLFGSGLIGLIAIARRKKAVN